ncbi:MAG: TIM barrel protein [Planctomycetaceae bacterium]|nr:TIM barrel protein [Planctomycetaceae bacterium]
MNPLDSSYSRRDLLRSTVAASAAGLTGLSAGDAFAADDLQQRALKGRLKQSIVHWCYKETFTVPQLAEYAKTLGCRSVELVPVEHWPMLKKLGLECAIASSHGFKVGPNHKKNWAQCEAVLTERINQCADFGFKSVITFTGMTEGIDPEEGAKNCVEFFKKIAPLAEKKKINVCLEMLNTRDDSHPMKGHPGYQGDDTEYCIDILNRVGSPRMKLLFDIYHVQIMNGDVIRRLHLHKDYIGHIHTAGNPGRGELDQTQEIQYAAVLNALADLDYDGFVGHEFIPTRDAHQGLREAVELTIV